MDHLIWKITIKQNPQTMKRTANAHWNGTLQAGQGEITTQSTVLNKTQYSFKTRFADGIGTNPEELLAAAHAGCFTMAVGAALTQAGFTPNDLTTDAILDLDMQALEHYRHPFRNKGAAIDGVDEANSSKKLPKAPKLIASFQKH
jgi:osmotically inducible protein OsmC